MAKLSKIFESIENIVYEKEKYQYFAEKLFESLKLEEGLSKTGFKIEQVEEKILSEALKYSSEKEAIDFLKGIEKEFLINEKWTDTLVSAGQWVSKKVGKLIDKVKSWWNGPVKTAVKKFNDMAIVYADELQSKARISLNQSMEYNGSNKSYLMENEEIEELENTDILIQNLFDGKSVNGKKTGSNQPRVKYYSITKIGNDITLWVGPDHQIESMNVLGEFTKSTNKLFLNLDTNFISSQMEMGFISELLTSIKNNPQINPDNYYGEIKQNGKKIILIHNNKNIPIIPGKILILGLANKSNTTIKIKETVDQNKFMQIFGIEDAIGTTSPIEKSDDEPKQEDFIGSDGKPDIDAYNKAFDEWSEKHDSDSFGNDSEIVDNEYIKGLEDKILKSLNITVEQIKNESISSIIMSKFQKDQSIKFNEIPDYNEYIASVMEYYTLKKDDKIFSDKLNNLSEDLTKIVEQGYLIIINKELESVDDISSKEKILSSALEYAMELSVLAKSFDITFKYDAISVWTSNLENPEIIDTLNDKKEKIEANSENAKELILEMVKIGSGNVDTALLEKLKVDKNKLWTGFIKFANSHHNDIADIIRGTNASGHYTGMTQNEFLAYAGTLETMLAGIINKKAILTNQAYEINALQKFINDVKNAASILSQHINATTMKATKDTPDEKAKKVSTALGSKNAENDLAKLNAFKAMIF